MSSFTSKLLRINERVFNQAPLNELMQMVKGQEAALEVGAPVELAVAVHVKGLPEVCDERGSHCDFARAPSGTYIYVHLKTFTSGLAADKRKKENAGKPKAKKKAKAKAKSKQRYSKDLDDPDIPLESEPEDGDDDDEEWDPNLEAHGMSESD